MIKTTLTEMGKDFVHAAEMVMHPIKSALMLSACFKATAPCSAILFGQGAEINTKALMRACTMNNPAAFAAMLDRAVDQELSDSKYAINERGPEWRITQQWAVADKISQNALIQYDQRMNNLRNAQTVMHEIRKTDLKFN